MAKGIKTGGRQKGTPNKNQEGRISALAKLWKDDLQMVIDKNDLAQLTPSARVDLLIKLSAFVVPKPQAATPKEEVGNAIPEEITNLTSNI